MFCGRLAGGLGNQLFQVSFYHWLSEKLQLDFSIDISAYKDYRLHNGLEVFDVFDFSFEPTLVSERKPELLNKLLKIQSYIFHHPGYRVLCNKRFFEKDVPYILSQHNLRNFYVEGYFQNCAYPDRDSLSFKTKELNDKEENLFVRKKCEEGSRVFDRTLAVHIRGGDYLTRENKAIFGGICGRSYYHAALSRFDLSKTLVCVFSDDPVYVSSLLPDIKYTLVNWNHGFDSWRDMLLMSLCDGLIISNSTFAWWGAFLSGSKSVVSPSIWNHINNGLFENVPCKQWSLVQ